MTIKRPLENVCSATVNSTFKVLNPIKKAVIKTKCEVHRFIQRNALDILYQYMYYDEYILFSRYINDINKGIVWADQDFKSYNHFYNPNCPRNKFGSDSNALTLAKKYYNKSLEWYKIGEYSKAMFLFGASCHLVQDLAVPQHAKGTVLDNHIQFESYVRANYKKIKKFKSQNPPIRLNTLEDYLDYNGLTALEIDRKYRNYNIKDRFHLTALECITLAQESSAGFMIMYYYDLQNL